MDDCRSCNKNKNKTIVAQNNMLIIMVLFITELLIRFSNKHSVSMSWLTGRKTQQFLTILVTANLEVQQVLSSYILKVCRQFVMVRHVLFYVIVPFIGNAQPIHRRFKTCGVRIKRPRALKNFKFGVFWHALAKGIWERPLIDYEQVCIQIRNTHELTLESAGKQNDQGDEILHWSGFTQL